MINFRILVLFGVLLVTTACEKRKYPEDNVQVESADIYCNAYFGNEPIALKIGSDGYFCYSSYKQRSDSIYVFGGELKKINCNPCPISFKVELADYMPRSFNSPVPPDSVFRTGSRNFIPGLGKMNLLRFVAHSNKEISSLLWSCSNGLTSQNAATDFEFGQPGIQTVSLTVRTTGNCESMVVNKFFVGGEAGLFACGINVVPVQNTISQFSAEIIGGKAPFSYTWYFGDGSSSNETSPSHDYLWNGSYPVKLRVVDADKNVCESNYTNIVGNDNSSCAANISLVNLGSRNAFLNGVKVQWTDQSNSILRSDSITQPAESYFEVITSGVFEPNERGEPGRLLTLRFNVLLSDGSRKVWLKSDNTAIAVSYK